MGRVPRDGKDAIDGKRFGRRTGRQALPSGRKVVRGELICPRSYRVNIVMEL